MDSLIENTTISRFRSSEEVRDRLWKDCREHDDIASAHELGQSEQGRPIDGFVLGHGSRVVSLIAGNHADEPVGPETLRIFILEALAQRDRLGDLFETYRFVVVPHTNPDGESRNQEWIKEWPNLKAYLLHVSREGPGRDLEFGFPSLRLENEHISSFLGQYAPYILHVSFHGMGFSEGAMLLIERHWAFRTRELRKGFVAAALEAGLDVHDHNRMGEKGFFYIEPGFTTTPEGEAMRYHFRALGDDAMAGCFMSSSMEYVRSLGGDPLCLVTELPLFVIHRGTEREPGKPLAYLAFKDFLPRLQRNIHHKDVLQTACESYGFTPVNLRTAVSLHLHALKLGLHTATEHRI